MGDRTGLCEATPEEECNEAGESKNAITEVAVASFASGVSIRQ
jgi:hypothetical protein